MRQSFSTTALVALLTTFVSGQSNTSYMLKDDLSYQNFFQNFEFFSGPDPTNGFVQYQDKQSAVDNQYVGYFDDTKSVYLGVDSKEKDPKGRKSVRLESTKSWNKGLLVADIRHMPDSTCGTWPAFWTLGVEGKWPESGEIDILEGVNDQDAAAVTLHTAAGCAVDDLRQGSGVQGAADASSTFLGDMVTDNCDVDAPNQDKNAGCSIKAPKPQSHGGLPTYGTKFNNAGGGVYAMEWTDDAIAVWFFPRNSSVAGTISSSSPTASSAPNATQQRLDISNWGTPLARFTGRGCDFAQRFRNHKVIFDTTFCGDWAGKVWDQSCAKKTGAKTCQEYVQNNPEAFADAYWEIGSLKWFESTGGEPVKRNVRQPGRPVRW